MSGDNDSSNTMLSQASEWMGISHNQMQSIGQCRSLRSNTDNFKNEVPSPSIKSLKTKDYLNVSRITECDHLTDKNWHEWKDCML